MKKLYSLVLIFIFTTSSLNFVYAQCATVTAASITNPGNYTIATLTENDGVRNGPNYNGATIYYPTNATPPYASIAIVPGFVSAPSTVQDWGPFYASHGYVAIIIGTNSLFDFPEARANALLDALETMKQENIRMASPLFGKLNLNKLVVSGWSMGGGGAQRAAVLDNTISGVIALCPYLLAPQLNHQSPLLIFSGQADPTAPPAQHADLHYNATPSTTSKMLFEVANGNHSVANTPTGANGDVGKIAISWLKKYVDNDDCYCNLLKNSLLANNTQASKINQNFQCDGVLNVLETNSKIGVYPNPAKDFIIVDIQEKADYKLYSSTGKLVLTGKISKLENKINVQKLSAGVFYLEINNQVIKIIKVD
ncbi:poly(ethylene terephthalate) hydrolase family protein [Frigoriflavimonas asaccharolytica]|uniref:Dienelactone hydrolase n=1 Tax=Frigoriflavimonas asaccharolytica TaxID=2735899 RepID=A0A8J8GBV2_9FLAO|nr:T9SS type A sorting domain-containing protein [Frigoriflavimonas asaccharolytica]NRS92842.1 dienelactone hydrolase [Frigoriflavimonas asaccharolytica]